MRYFPFTLLTLSCLVAVAIGGDFAGMRRTAQHAPSEKLRVAERLVALPLAFEANVGQTDEAAEFVARGEGYTVALGAGEAALLIGAKSKTPSTVRMKPWRGNPKARVRPERKLRGQISYFLGNDPKEWRVGVPTYEAVRWEGVYPGIDLVYHGAQEQLEYDFVVHPGAAPSQIGVEISGDTGLALDYAGNLLIHTTGGTVTKQRPVVYQETPEGRHGIEGSFVLAKGGPLRFDIGNYDRSLPLVIDPVIAMSTYLGGTGDDTCDSIVVKEGGVVYLSGMTSAGGFPTLGQYPRPGGWSASRDIYVTKLDTRMPGSDGLIYSAYLGGGGLEITEEGEGLAVDSSGAAYVTGQTFEAGVANQTFPVVNGYQTNQVGEDAFVAKLDTTSSGAAALEYSTYLGGKSEDYGMGVAADDTGRVFVTGYTHSSNFPKLGEIAGDQSSYECFVTAFDTLQSGAASLLYSTYLSGASTSTSGQDLFLDSAGTLWVTGSVGGANLPTINAYQGDQPGNDVFAARIDPTQTGAASLLYCTYLGGSGNERGNVIAQDGTGHIYITGYTQSSDFPTVNGFQGDQTGQDLFLVKLDPQVSGSGALLYSTYLGGAGLDTGIGMAVASATAVYVAGQSDSTDFPTRDALMTDPGDANFDAILAKIDTTAVGDPSLIYSTYLGGNARDGGLSVGVDTAGTVYLAGYAWSNNFPTTTDALQPTKPGAAGTIDATLTVISPGGLLARPTALSATPVVSPIAIDLAWTDNTAANDGYFVESRVTGAGDWTRIATLGNVTSWRHEGPGVAVVTSYDYRVQAYAATDESYFSNRATATTLDYPPGAPSSLVVTVPAAPDGESKLNLAWTDGSSNETGFKIERKSGVGSFAEIVQVGAGVTSYTNTNLPQDTAFTYRVRAFNTGGNSGYSNEASAATRLAAPTFVYVQPLESTRVFLSWPDNSTTESGFRIERNQGAGAFAQIASVGANVVSYINGSLAPNTAYTYRVRAYRSSVTSAYSTEMSGTTFPLPAAPSALSAVAVDSVKINLTWTDNSGDETGFKVERKSGMGAFSVIASAPANSTSYANKNLTPGTTYTYRLRSYRGSDLSPYSDEAGAATLPLPNAPGNLTATPVSSVRINLAWTDNSADESGFKVERKIGMGSYSVIATRPANSTSYPNLGLTLDTAYTYRVRAYRTTDYSAYTDEVTASPKPLPAAASNLSATTATSTRINLAWTDNSTDETGFKIERKTGMDAFALVATTSANATTYANTGLVANTSYTYRVRSYRESDFAFYSDEASATTLPLLQAPTDLSATPVGATRINLVWTDNSGDETGFKVERKTGAGAYTVISSLPAGRTSYSSIGLTANTTYTYRVRAYRGTEYSTYSNEAEATTLP